MSDSEGGTRSEQAAEGSAEAERAPRWTLIVDVALALLILAFTCSAVAFLYDGRWTVTKHDGWAGFERLLTTPLPESVLAKYNQHSFIFPLLIAIAVVEWFANDQNVLFWIGLAFTLGTWGFVVWNSAKDERLSRTARLAAVLSFTTAALWMQKGGILAAGANAIGNSLVTLLAIIAFIGLIDSNRESGVRWLPLSICFLAAFIASFSFGGGFAVWLVLAAFVVMYRLGWTLFLLFTVGFIISIGIFLVLPTGSGDTTGAGTDFPRFAHLPTLLHRYCLLLGASVFYVGRSLEWGSDAFRRDVVTPLAGAFAMLAALSFMIWRTLKPVRPSRTELAAVGFALLALLTSGFVILGRQEYMNVIGHALGPRYVFWTAFLWGALPVFAICAAARYRWRLVAAIASAVALPILVWPDQIKEARHWRFARLQSEAAATSLIAGVHDNQATPILYKEPSRVYRVAAMYRERRLDMFISGLHEIVDQPLANLRRDERAAASAIAGTWRIDSLFADAITEEPAVRISGWALHPGTRTAPDYAVVSDGSGIIRGLGRFVVDAPAQNRSHFVPRREVLGFAGYIKSFNAAERYACHVVVDGSLVDTPVPLEPGGEMAPLPDSVAGSRIIFSATGASRRYRISGWSKPERTHTWTNGTSAVMTFPIGKHEGALLLKMRMQGAIKLPELPHQPVEVLANGHPVAAWQVAQERDFSAVIPAEAIRDSDELKIELRLPRAVSPKMLGTGQDRRQLGVSVRHVELLPADSAAPGQ